MQAKLFGAVLAMTLSMSFSGTAQAGWLHSTEGPLLARYIEFDALPGESPDLRLRVTDNASTVTITDRANPITPGKPPLTYTRNVTSVEVNQPCEIVSTHTAQCTIESPDYFRGLHIATWQRAESGTVVGGPARVRDMRGDGSLQSVSVLTGPLADVIDLRHQDGVFVSDLGGFNEIRIGAGGGFVRVGPGGSHIDVRNGNENDQVRCMQTPGELWSFNPVVWEQPELGIGEHNRLDTVLTDPGDVTRDCPN